MRRLTLILLTMLMAPLAHAADAPQHFRFCSADISHPPYTNAQGTGYFQLLLRHAAQSAGVDIEWQVAPRKRCLQMLKHGDTDGVFAGYSHELAAYGAYPMANGAPDPDKALGTVPLWIFRRTGSALDWDGKRFLNLGTGKIGIPAGSANMIIKLQRHGADHDDGGKTLEQNLEKLALGRLAGVVSHRSAAEALIGRRFAGQLEAIPIEFERETFYLAVNKTFHASRPTLMKAYWQAIADHKK